MNIKNIVSIAKNPITQLLVGIFLVIFICYKCSNTSSPDAKEPTEIEKRSIVKNGIKTSSVFRIKKSEYHVWTLHEIKSTDQADLLRADLGLSEDNNIYFYSDSTLDEGHYYATFLSVLLNNPVQSFRLEPNKNIAVKNLSNNIVAEIKNGITIHDKGDILMFLSQVEKISSISEETNSKEKNELLTFQKKHFPVARKAYYNNAKSELWEKNIEVSMSGRDITFIGYMFADNKVKKDTYLQIKDELTKLRFKSVSFIIFEGGEGTRWDLDSKKDSEI